MTGIDADLAPFAHHYSLLAFGSPIRLDDFRHRHAKLVFNQNDFAASDEAGY